MAHTDFFIGDKLLVDSLLQIKTAVAIHVGPNAVIQLANDAMLHIWDKDKSVIGKPLEDALPELKGQPFIGLFKKVWDQGITVSGTDTAATLKVNGELKTFYFDFEYRALLNGAGNTYCILHTATDVTDRVTGRLASERAAEQQIALEKEQSLNEELASLNEELNAMVEELRLSEENLAGVNNELEERVLERTEELMESESKKQTLNEELSTSLDEIAAINEELTAAIEEQKAANDDLLATQNHLDFTITQLQQSEARFQNLVRDATVGIIVLIGENMKVEIVNDSYARLIGRSAADILYKNLFEVIPETEAYFRPVIDQVRNTGVPIFLYDTPYEVQSNNNTIKGYLDVVYQPYREGNNTISGVIVLCQDVTEKVIARKKNEDAEESLRLATEAANIGTFDMNLEKGVLEWDKRCRTLFGINHSKPVTYDHDFVNGLHPNDRERVFAAVAHAYNKAKSNGNYDIEYRTIGAEDHKLRWLRARGKVYFNDQDKPIRFLGSVLDITEQKQDEQRKNDFIGMVSHELKTPLTSLSAYLQMLAIKANKNDDEFTVGALNKANKQIRKMTTMINGFLNVARLESGKINIDTEQFDMTELVKEVEEEAKATITSHQITFAPTAKTYVNADREKIGQVINNFISNAVKYSPSGTLIEVACIIKGNAAEVCVKDHGLGIRAEDQEKLFDRFYRVEDKNSHTISGFGIGLYLSAEIIHRHQGKIWVESEFGAGSTFCFSIPLQNH